MGYKLNQKGVTLVELIVVIAIIGIAVLAIAAPQIGRFRSNYNLRSCATDLIQNMRVARSMAIKENRAYLITFNENTGNNYRIGFDGDGNNSLLNASDGYGECVGAGCVRLIDLSDCGNDIGFGTLATKKPNGNDLDATACNNKTVCFGSTSPIRAEFYKNGSVATQGSVYFQHTGRGYSYAVVISTFSGATNMFKWDGDIDNTDPPDPEWTEMR